MSNSEDKVKVSKTRRGALKTASTGAFAAIAAAQIPGKWKQPVVNSIILPSHALTSAVSPGGGELTTTPAATTQPVTTQPVTTQPVTTQPATTQPGSTPPGSTPPGSTPPGSTPPGSD